MLLQVRAKMQIGGQVLIELAGPNVPLHFHTLMVYTEIKQRGQVMIGYISWKKPNVAITETLMLNAFKLIGLSALTEIAIGICVHQDTISLGFTVQMATTSTILSMRGVANLVERPIPTNLVTMKTFGQDLSGIEKE